MQVGHVPIDKIFQSTLSLRRATFDAVSFRVTMPDFNPRSPCGERHCR